jgi:hypothetical protein
LNEEKVIQQVGAVHVQLGYLEVTVQEKLRSGWPGPFVKVEGCCVSHSFAFSVSRRLKLSYKSILPCTAFHSTLVSMLELSPPLPVLLLLRVGGLSRLNTARVTVQEKLCSGWPGPFVKVEGCCVSHSSAFSASRRLKFSHSSILPCTAFLSTLVSMLELSPPLPVLLLLRVGGLSRLYIARVFRSDSPGKAAQWLARSIRES